MQQAALLEGQRVLRAEMAVALAEKEFQLQALSDRGGSELLNQQQENARALAETLEAEKEKRIAHTQQMAAMRMGKQQLSKGWQSWLDGWLEQQRHKRMLAASAGRLMKPALSAALTHWRTDWQATQQAILEEGQRLMRAEADGRSIEQQAEIDAVRAEMAAALLEKDEELRKLEESFGADISTQEQERARKLEADKEKRTAHVMQMAVMRLGKRQLSLGWQTWLDAHLEQQRKKRILAASAGRLSKPALSVCLALWRRDWEAELMKDDNAWKLSQEKKRTQLQSSEMNSAHQKQVHAHHTLLLALATTPPSPSAPFLFSRTLGQPVALFKSGERTAARAR